MKQSSSAKTVLVVLGPTAVGKTSVSIALAKHFGTEIISADSRQCFKEMSVGTAVPSPEELNAVPHHFIHSHSIREEMNAGQYERWALKKAEQVFQHKDLLFLVGGTGLYIKSFCEGIDQIPKIPKEIENQIRAAYKEKGLSWLQNQLKRKAPEEYEKTEKDNPQRLMRSLSVLAGTGHPISHFQKSKAQKRPFRILKIGLRLPREEIKKRIDERTEYMFATGLLDEARRLYPDRDLNALQTVGYNELFDFFDGKYTLEEAKEWIKIHTRQYAKRQMTWFKKDKEIHWFSPFEIEKIRTFLSAEIQK